MDNNTTQGHPEGCKCGVCHGNAMLGCACGRRHWVRILIKVVIIVFVFWAGVQFGELKGMLRGEYYRYGMIGSHGGWGQWGGPTMMQGGVPGTAPKPSTGTTTWKQ